MTMKWFKKGKSSYAEIKIHGREMIFTEKEIEKAIKRKYGIFKRK